MSTDRDPARGAASALGPGPAVVVVSRARAVGDAVRTAVRAQGLAAISIAVPTTAEHFRDARRVIDTLPPAVGLFLTDLGTPPRLREAAAVVRQIDLVWLVVTPTWPGAAWAAIVEVGASDVFPDQVALSCVFDSIQSHCADPTQEAGAQSGPPLVDAQLAWRGLAPEQRDLTRRLMQLSPREMYILSALHAGSSTNDIAEYAGATTLTIRTQVKSLLRTIGVRSQLEAVASYERAVQLLAP